MSLLGKITGSDKRHNVRDRVMRDIAAQFESGRAEAGVVVSQREVPGRLDTFGGWLRQEIEEAGYRVTEVNDGGWTYQLTMRVMPRL
jgi:hypothetical protein